MVILQHQVWQLLENPGNRVIDADRDSIIVNKEGVWNRCWIPALNRFLQRPPASCKEPQTAEEVAKAANLNLRYVEETQAALDGIRWLWKGKFTVEEHLKVNTSISIKRSNACMVPLGGFGIIGVLRQCR